MNGQGYECHNLALNNSSNQMVHFGTNLFTDMAAILNSIVSKSSYGMLRGEIDTNLPLKHPIIAI